MFPINKSRFFVDMVHDRLKHLQLVDFASTAILVLLFKTRDSV